MPDIDEDGFVSLSLTLAVTDSGRTRTVEKFIRVKDGDTIVIRGPILPRDFTPDQDDDTGLTAALAATRRGEEVVWMITPHIMK